MLTENSTITNPEKDGTPVLNRDRLRPTFSAARVMMAPENLRLLGITEFDEDHLKLAHIIAELELYCGYPASVGLAAIGHRLVEATRAHFRSEEEVMARRHYPLLECHRASHQDLLQFVESLASELSGGRITVDEALISTLWEWELVHIDTADREYAEYARQHIGALETT